MAFIHNDIATKQRLRDALNEEGSMGFEHNDIVTVDVMNAAIAAGGGGGGETVNWLIDNASTTVAWDDNYECYCAVYNLPDSITADNLDSTFSDKNCVTIVDGKKVEAPATISEGIVTIHYWNALYDSINQLQLSQYELHPRITSYSEEDEGKTATFSLGIVEE